MEESPPVSLSSVLAGDVDAAYSALTKRGWCFVELTPELSRCAEAASANLSSWMEANDSGARWKHRRGPFGYGEFDGKRVYRFPSGSELLGVSEELAGLRDLAAALDSALLGVTEALSERMLGGAFHEVRARLAERFPLLRDAEAAEPRFALFDAAVYGKRMKNKRAAACVEHYDPGLLTLSVLSSAPGLELQDENGAWVAGPIGSRVGVLWAGDAAHELDAAVVPARHRVRPTASRMAMWSELATEAQAVPNPRLRMNPQSPSPTRFETPTMLVVPNMGSSEKVYRVPVVKGDMAGAMRLVEELYGLPFSKIMKPVNYAEDGTVKSIGFNT